MKAFSTFICLFLAGYLAAQTSNVAKLPKTGISWESQVVELGKIPQNKPVDVNFNFENNDSKPVVIEAVKASCSCTAPYYPKSPIAPGASDFVTARFNAAGLGMFTKTVTVTFVGQETPVILTFKGEVVKE
jgi:hypothetical protein